MSFWLALVQGCPVFLLMLAVGAMVAHLVLEQGEETAATSSEDPAAAILIALGWAIGIIPLLAFIFHLAFSVPVTLWLLLGCSLINGVAAGLLLHRRRSAGASWRILFPLERVRAALGRSRVLLVAVAGVGLVYFLKYDNSLAQSSCLQEAVDVALGTPGNDLSVDLLSGNVGDARLGNVALLSTFGALFGDAGGRILATLCGFMMALGGFLIGRRVGGHAGWAWMALFLLPLNPYVASIPQIDGNLLALAFSAPVLALVVSRYSNWPLAGIQFGLVVMMRHAMLPAGLALICSSRIRTGDWKAAVRFLLAFTITTLPMHLHHYFSMGSFFRFESNTQFPEFPYSFLGFPFSWEGMLNWPFIDQVVRTPHNPFPMFATWPMVVADHLGLVLFAAMVLGFAAIWFSSTRQAAFWVFWSLVVLAGLMVQEAWDYVSKMGVILILFPAFVAWIVAGLALVLRRPAIGIPGLIVLIVAGQGLIGFVRDWKTVPDERYRSALYFKEDGPRTREGGEHLKYQAERITDIGLLPDMGRFSEFGPLLSRHKVLELFCSDDRGDSSSGIPWGWHPCESPGPGPAVTVELDLTSPLYGRQEVLRLTSDPPDVDLTLPGRSDTVYVHGLETPWGERPVKVWATAGTVTALFVSFLENPSDSGWSDSDCDNRIEACWVIAGLAGSPTPEGASRVIHHGSSRLRLRIPSGGVNVGLEINLAADRLLMWKGRVSATGIELNRPVEFWHN